MNKILTTIISTVCCVYCLNCNVCAETMDLPNADTNVHTYMDYNCITNENSSQWKLQADENTYTTKSGLRVYAAGDGEKYFLVALGSNYGTEIGSTYKITLDNGSEFKIMLGDCKGKDANSGYGHSCYNFITDEQCINVIEFIVDTKELPDKVTSWGSLTAFDFFNGNITSIEYIDREWYPP